MRVLETYFNMQTLLSINYKIIRTVLLIFFLILKKYFLDSTKLPKVNRVVFFYNKGKFRNLCRAFWELRFKLVESWLYKSFPSIKKSSSSNFTLVSKDFLSPVLNSKEFSISVLFLRVKLEFKCVKLWIAEYWKFKKCLKLYNFFELKNIIWLSFKVKEVILFWYCCINFLKVCQLFLVDCLFTSLVVLLINPSTLMKVCSFS